MSEVQVNEITFDNIISLAKTNRTKWVQEFCGAGKGHGKRLGMELLQKIYPNGELYDFDINVFDTVFIHHLCLETLVPLSKSEIIEQLNEVDELEKEMEKKKRKETEVA